MPVDSQELATFKERIARGLAAQKKYANLQDWTAYEDYYLGIQRAGATFVNYMFALARALNPMVYFRNPRVMAVPRKAGMDQNAETLSAVDNWWIQEMEIKQHMKAVPYDNFFYGIGLIKLGYDSEFGFDEDNLMAPMATPMGVADLSAETPTQRVKNFVKMLTGQVKPQEKHMDMIEYNSTIQPGMPWAMRWAPRDFIIEPGATSTDDAQWCAFRIMRKLEDVQADGKYENTSGLTPGYSEEYFDQHEERMVAREMPSRSEAQTAQTEPRRDDWVELWELHDKKNQRIQVGATNHDKFLRNERDPLQIDGLPVLVLTYNKNPRSFWGVPEARNLKPLQDELNRVTLLQEEYLKANVRRLITRKSVITATEKQKFMSDTPVAFIETDDESVNLKDAIFQVQGFIPPDLMQRAEQIRADMREILGLGRNQLGEWNRGEQGGAGRGTATEANIVQQNAQIRVDERRDGLADLLSKIIRRTNQMIFKWWETPRVIRIAGPSGAQWRQYTGVELKGEYDYLIEPDDALPMTRDRRRQEAMALFQLLGQDPFIDPIGLRLWFLERFEGLNASQLVRMPPQMAGAGPSAPGGMPGGMPPGGMNAPV